MEEQQIQEFVHRVTVDEALRYALIGDPVDVVAREGYSPRVAQIIYHLLPHLAFNRPLAPTEKWWHA